MMKSILVFLFALVSISVQAQVTCTYSGKNCVSGQGSSTWSQLLINNIFAVSAYGTCRKINTSASGQDVFIPLGSAAEWMSFVNHPPGTVTSANCDCTGAVAWTVGGKTCNSYIGAAIPEGNSTAAVDSDPSDTGVAGSSFTTGSTSFQCVSGSFVQAGGSCNQSCTAQSLNWNVGSDNCTASVSQTSNGGSVTITDSTTPGTGSATFTCNNGSWSSPSSPTCTSISCNFAGTSLSGAGGAAQPTGCKCNNAGDAWCATTQTCETTTASCASASPSWGAGCSGSLGAVSHGQSSTANNAAANYSGSASWTCNNGSWSGPTSQSCNYTTCNATNLSWNSNCSGGISLTANGGSATVTNSAANFTGSATFTCNNGSWSAPSGATCNQTGGPCYYQVDYYYGYATGPYCVYGGTPTGSCCADPYSSCGGIDSGCQPAPSYYAWCGSSVKGSACTAPACASGFADQGGGQNICSGCKYVADNWAYRACYKATSSTFYDTSHCQVSGGYNVQESGFPPSLKCTPPSCNGGDTQVSQSCKVVSSGGCSGHCAVWECWNSCQTP